MSLNTFKCLFQQIDTFNFGEKQGPSCALVSSASNFTVCQDNCHGCQEPQAGPYDGTQRQKAVVRCGLVQRGCVGASD